MHLAGNEPSTAQAYCEAVTGRASQTQGRRGREGGGAGLVGREGDRTMEMTEGVVCMNEVRGRVRHKGRALHKGQRSKSWQAQGGQPEVMEGSDGGYVGGV